MRPAPPAENRPSIARSLSIGSRTRITGLETEFRLCRTALQPFSRASPGGGSLQGLKIKLFAATHAYQTKLRSRINTGFKLLQQCLHASPVVADRKHITPCRQRAPGALGQIADGGRAGHCQIIGKYQPAEAKPLP